MLDWHLGGQACQVNKMVREQWAEGQHEQRQGSVEGFPEGLALQAALPRSCQDRPFHQVTSGLKHPLWFSTALCI